VTLVGLLWSRYNLPNLVDHFHQRGLYRSIFLRVMEGEESLPLFSPELLVLSPAFQEAVPHLPSISLFHGTADCSIHHEASVAFGNALQSVGATVTTILYAGKTHTDLLLQVCCFDSSYPVF
jgi:prenylcysteine alpha-carboxyl methylesterase